MQSPEPNPQENLDAFEPESSEPSLPEQRSPASRKRLWIGVGLSLAIAAGALGSRLLTPSSIADPVVAEEAEDAASANLPSVSIASVESAPISRTLTLSGTVAATDMLPVLPKSPGLQIEEVLVEEGDSVQAGQVMAVLDDSVVRSQITEAQAQVSSTQSGVDQAQAGLLQAQASLGEAQAGLVQAQARLAQAQASLAQTERDFARYESLAQEGITSEQDLDARRTAVQTAKETVRVAEADVQSAQARLASANANVRNAQASVGGASSTVNSNQARVEQLETQLGRTLVRAPAAGIVAEKLARVGDVTASSGKLFSLIRDGVIELQVKVPETQLAQVRIGARVEVRSDADDRINLEGRVREIAPLVDPQTREALVKIDLPNADLLRPGMFLQAALVTDQTPGQTVPAKAVLPQPNGSAIVYRVVEGDRVQAQTVALGNTLPGQGGEAERIEIRQGLELGDRIVVAGAAYLKDGDRVRIVETTPGS